MSAEAVLTAMRAQHLRLATAESCTGGGIGQAITAVAGSSDVYMGGVIAYANAVKSSLLHVPPAMIREHGAVSGPVAEAMARGVLRAINANIAVSVTGIAGPGGGSEDKPVGTVYIGLARRRGSNIETLAAHNLFEDRGRNGIQDAAIAAAFALILTTLTEL